MTLIYNHYVKRCIDILLSSLIVVVLAIPMLIIAVAIKMDSKGPVIFKQKRIGLHGKEFYIYKFRTMVVNAEHTGSGVYSGKGDARVTRVGRILRATSVDELPQTFNILRGDMAFIGPRPPLTYHPWPYEEYTEEQKQMFSVRPGITGWAQVHGRKDVEWHRRIEMNVWYTEHVSFWLDVKICFLTVFKVLSNADNENAGATVLDVFEEEPLAENSPLWDMKHVILTPHNSFVGDQVANRLLQKILTDFKEGA